MSFWKNKNVVITGGAGFIGSSLTKNLVAEGSRVTVVDNLDRGKVEFLDSVLDDITFIRQDLRDPSFRLDRPVDIIIHLASKVRGIGYYTSSPHDVMRDNILIDSNVLDMALKLEVKYFFMRVVLMYIL